MPCRQVSTFNGLTGSGQSGGGGYTTEADCLQACREGACCEGTTCTVKPQCQCQGTGKTFKGVGTVCAPNPCIVCSDWFSSLPQTLTVELQDCIDNAYGTDFATMNGTYTVTKGVPEYVFPLRLWRVSYEFVPGPGKKVYVEVDCLSFGTKARYTAFVRVATVYGVDGVGTLRNAPPGCYAETLSGGNPSFLSCTFVVTCNPLP